ncbi:NUDIX hydrolase [Rhizobium azibense]|uniref:8-oxo-dGTP diphosphatase n=1 Tax=Rhizobium azibense TaxID=1136135 RepID=A0A4V2VDK6_9HYPH|nr:NUDIX domain-containing protein [Rhizobium azibense]TCU33115.1 8-oxo-dGTP diphosphatase [Rhizobium azibense]
MHSITKVGMAVISDGKILLVRKRGNSYLILPGGKPEAGEDDLTALSREIKEELGCQIRSTTLRYSGCFTDVAAGMKNTTVSVRLYIGSLEGDPRPCAEIESLEWLPVSETENPALAPSLRNSILPCLAEAVSP